MAIDKNIVHVYGGNAGWSSSSVLDALEETFEYLGWNSGTAVNGMVTSCYPPTGTSPWNVEQWDTDWAYCGGAVPTGTDFVKAEKTHRYFIIDDTVNEEFKLTRAWYFTTGNASSDYIEITDHGFTTGDSFKYYQGVDNRLNYDQWLYSGAANGDTVYVSVIDENSVYLHTTQSDATNGINMIDIINFNRGHYLRNISDQTTIDDIRQADTIKWVNYETSTTSEVYVQDSTGAYDSNRLINTTNYNALSHRAFPNHDVSLSSTVDVWRSWDTEGWEQGTYYLTGTAATYSIPFNILPSNNVNIGGSPDATRSDRNLYPYYDYQVPLDGSRSALNLRIYRRGGGNAYIYGIEVLDSNTSGWSDNESFVIPGDQIGGTSPANDITFGVNTAETVAGAGDGICSIKTTNIGSVANSYLKNYANKTLLVRIENDAGKTYGTTFYRFKLSDANNYQLSLDSFIDPDFLNYDPQSSTNTYNGMRGGEEDLDWSPAATDYTGRISHDNTVNHSFTGSATPDSYPLKIVTYRATTPQDTDFAVISFVQVLNGVDTPYFTFSIHKGTGYGQSVWDLDYVWQGSYTVYNNNTKSIFFETMTGQSYISGEESNSSYKMAREALYGYSRDLSDQWTSLVTKYTTNRYYDNAMSATGSYYYDVADSIVYYRDHVYDKQRDSTRDTSYDNTNINDFVATGPSVSSSANFDRVIKGLPLANNVSPSLYYLPNDFVLIDFNYTPGATTFIIGDTITISASEVYEVIRAGYTNAATTYDGVTANSVHGLLFCARTT
jgi:hypothetical protein